MKTCNDCKKEITGVIRCDKWIENAWSIMICEDCYKKAWNLKIKENEKLRETQEKERKSNELRLKIQDSKLFLQSQGYEILPITPKYNQ